MSEPRALSAGQVDRQALHHFLERFFGPTKADFLDRHGDWWHRGPENRIVLEVDGEIAGYNAVIPTRCEVAGETIDAVWWMDLVIAPEFRGRRLQSLLDEDVRSRARLLLGFPNELAAKIHRNHGWGVREDLRARLLPLDPRAIGAVQRASGARGAALRTGAAALTPAAALWRRWLGSRSPGKAWEAVQPTAEELRAVAQLGPKGTVTSSRGTEDLRWRYLECPYRRELRFFFAGDPSRPRLALVLRQLPGGTARVLDIFGSLDDGGALDDLLKLAIAECAGGGATQVVALAASATLSAALRRRGFFLSSTGRFCWWSADRAIMEAIAQGPFHWCLGDSDNDEPR